MNLRLRWYGLGTPLGPDKMAVGGWGMWTCWLRLASVSSGVAVPGLFRGVPGGSSGVSRGLFRGVPGPFQDTNIYLVCILLPWAIFFGGGQARREGVWAA